MATEPEPETRLPQWVVDRLEADLEMGRRFDDPYERAGFMVGTVIGLGLRAAGWLVVIAVVGSILYAVGRALVGP